jgi:hypothetical protein
MHKLSAYSTSAITFIAVSQPAHAQIVYENIDPDLITEDERIFLDVNADGEFDLWFDLFNSGFFGAQYSSAYAGNQNPYLQLATNGLLPGAQGLKAFAAGETIDAADNWVTPAPFFGDLLGRFVFFDYYSCEDPLAYFPYGDFFDVMDGYLAFRIEEDGDYRYGWVRLSLPQAPPCPLPLGDALSIIVSDYAIQNSLNTPIAAGSVGCETPENPEAVATINAIKISWDEVAGAINYKIQYRTEGETDWENKTVPAPKTSRIIKGLDCNTTYEYKIAAICDGNISVFTTIQTVATHECKIDNAIVDQSLYVFPNPAADKIMVQTDDDIVINNITIFDLQGNVVVGMDENSDAFEINISTLPNGLYIVIAQTGSGNQQTFFMKQ